jgi:hypothetical protein
MKFHYRRVFLIRPNAWALLAGALAAAAVNLFTSALAKSFSGHESGILISGVFILCAAWFVARLSVTLEEIREGARDQYKAAEIIEYGFPGRRLTCLLLCSIEFFAAALVILPFA